MTDSKHAIGIDIGGTKMAVALVDSQGVLLEHAVLATEASQGFERAVNRLSEVIEALVQNAGGVTLAGIGIGCAGPLDSARGLINNPFTLEGWDQSNIVQPLQERFQVPAYLENDADVAAFGECASGAGRGFDPVVMLTFGTGIGGAAVIADRIYRGAKGEHPELGHIQVQADGPECYCGTRGCLESIASGTAIAAAGKAAGFADAPGVFSAAELGHPLAREIVEHALNAAATGAWTLFHTFLPQRLVLGGGMMEDHFERFAESICKRLETATQFTRGSVSIAPAMLGNDAGMIGAASLALARGTAPNSGGR